MTNNSAEQCPGGCKHLTPTAAGSRRGIELITIPGKDTLQEIGGKPWTTYKAGPAKLFGAQEPRTCIQEQ